MHIFTNMTFCVFKTFFFVLFGPVLILGLGRQSGPFDTAVLRFDTKCQTPSKPYETNPVLLFYPFLYNTTTRYNLIGGNVTVLKNVRNDNLKLHVKIFYIEGEQRELALHITSLTSRSVIVSAISKVMGYAKNNICSIKKGNYSLRGFDFNRTEHLWRKNMEYGLMVTRFELQSPVNTVACGQIFTNVTARL